MYKGGQTVVVGETKNDQDPIIVTTKANSRDGAVTTQTEYSPDNSVTDQKNCQFIKRFFAYLQIKQDLETAKTQSARLRNPRPFLDNAKKMALAFNFVTDQTSLVVKTTTEFENDDNYAFDEPLPSGAFLVTDDETWNISMPAFDSSIQIPNSPCKISLYSEENYLGDKIVFTSDVSDISVWDFEEKLQSLEVEGSCSWEVFAGKFYQGESLVFTSSDEYLDGYSVGELYLNTLSLKSCDGILYQGKCETDVYSPNCGVGQRLYSSRPGEEGYCGCDTAENGWLEVDGRCHQTLTPAFCGGNKILEISSNGQHACIPNPCKTDLSYPHMSDWVNGQGSCYRVNLPTDGNLEQCELQPYKGSLTCCTPQTRELPACRPQRCIKCPSGLLGGPSSCGSSMRWSTFRGKCFKIYG